MVTAAPQGLRLPRVTEAIPEAAKLKLLEFLPARRRR